MRAAARRSRYSLPMDECRWPALTAPILPAPDEVLLVSAAIDLPAARLAGLRATFSPHERKRDARFATSELRDRWSAGRGLLRELLAAALGADPARLKFRYGAHGKPELEPASAPAPRDGGPPLTFNVSHSQGRALYALARGREVGVDLEGIRERRSDGVANRFFAPAESAALRAIADEADRRRAFFFVWSAKEAFIKATGAGLSQSMSSFVFELARVGAPPGSGPDEARSLLAPVAVRSHRDDAQAHQRWSVHPVSPAGGFSGALVAEGAVRVRLCAWDAAAVRMAAAE